MGDELERYCGVRAEGQQRRAEEPVLNSVPRESDLID